MLAEIATLKECPPLQFSDFKLLKQIDVLWFKERGTNLIPQSAFEVELTTGIWSGVGRMSTLLEYADVGFYVISNNKSKFKQVLQTLPIVQNRFRHVERIVFSRTSINSIKKRYWIIAEFFYFNKDCFALLAMP